jgi:predicted DNA binding protein
MANRKFFTGDIVMLTHDRYSNHRNHKGQVMGTRRTRYTSDTKPTLVAYHVACECGTSLTPTAIHMDLVSTDSSLNVGDLRRTYFLRQVGISGDPERLLQQVNGTLKILTDQQRSIIVRRFGLEDGVEDGLTLQAIADILDVSKQYIQQVERKSLRKLRSSNLSRNPA